MLASLEDGFFCFSGFFDLPFLVGAGSVTAGICAMAAISADVVRRWRGVWFDGKEEPINRGEANGRIFSNLN